MVLPAPLGPSRPRTDPAGTSRFTPANARRVPERFARALQDQLYGSDDPATRFKRFADVLVELSAARWSLCTYFSFVRFPEEYMLLKPTLTQNAAARCRFDLDFRPEPNRVTYGRLLTFVRILSDVTTDLRPTDMFDVQSFMWCLASIKD